MRKTKIIATLGPATASYGKITALIKARVNVFRLNFSHGDFAFFSKLIAFIHRAEKKLGATVAIMQDLQGPKIRVGAMNKTITVKRGDRVLIQNPKSKIQNNAITIDFKDLYRYVRTGQRILINDGMVQMKIKKIKGTNIICRVTAGGEIAARKGVNLPGVKLPVPAMTARDRKNLKFGLKKGVDIVCLSFVREAKDMKMLNALIKGIKNRPLMIAKIEKPEALKQINAILDVSDGVMVARGDLAVEAGYKVVPEAQKSIIKKANAKGKIAIVATQMLESMINNPYPERAEITDVYNAVLDGADALMLSGETSMGKFPVKTVRTMSEIIKEAEKGFSRACDKPGFIRGKNAYEDVFAYVAAKAAEQLKDSAIAARAISQDDVRHISDYRPGQQIIALAEDKDMLKKMALYHGVFPLPAPGGIDAATGEIAKKFPRVKNIVYVDFHGHKKSKGELLVFKVR